jgi:glycosyltransferase involved in cell wall biosynthesis
MTHAPATRAPSALRVVHVITGLGVGGAENMLAKLLEAESAACPGRTVEVICLDAGGPMRERIERTGVRVTCLDLRATGLRGLALLRHRLRETAPHVVQGWMYHADLISGVVASVTVPRARRIWSIRASFMPKPSPLTTRLTIRLCALLSWFVPHRIISCSHTAADLHEQLGYRRATIDVIPNGFDLVRFAPDAAARSSVRSELALADDTPIIGSVGRFDPQKDYPTMFRAFAAFAADDARAVLVLIGRGLTADNAALQAMIPAAIRSRVLLLGPRSDIARLTAAFDVATLTSAYGEGFPNVLGEALACGVPCVATDVGDAAPIVERDGVVVPIGDADGVARGWREMLALSVDDRRAMTERARARVIREFDLRSVASRYWAVQQGDAATVSATVAPIAVGASADAGVE